MENLIIKGEIEQMFVNHHETDREEHGYIPEHNILLPLIKVVSIATETGTKIAAPNEPIVFALDCRRKGIPSLLYAGDEVTLTVNPNAYNALGYAVIACRAIPQHKGFQDYLKEIDYEFTQACAGK